MRTIMYRRSEIPNTDTLLTNKLFTEKEKAPRYAREAFEVL
jgi:hypothetical protein